MQSRVLEAGRRVGEALIYLESFRPPEKGSVEFGAASKMS